MPDSFSMPATTARPLDRRSRILFLIPSFKTGGAEIQLLSLVRGLDKSLFFITVATFYRGNELDAVYENLPDVRVVYLEKKNELDLSCIGRLYALIKKHRFDIVQSYNISARLFGTITAKLAGVPVITVTERTARLLYSSRGSRFYLFFEKFAMRFADLLIANSEAGRNFAVSRGIRRARTSVIYNGIDQGRLKVTKPKNNIRAEFSMSSDAFLVGMVARLEPLKDPFAFIEAAQKLIPKYENLYFILVGSGSLLDMIRDKVLKTDLKNNFLITGHRSDTADLLNSMNIMVLTSKEVEGCSNVLLEAMTLGVPVIATRVGGNAEVIEHEKTGLLIPPAKPLALVEAIERLYHNKALRIKCADNARKKTSTRFSQSKMVTAHEKLYRRLIAARKGGR